MMSGIVRYQPESAMGTIGTMIARPATASAKPHRMMFAGRRLRPRPASSATTNMLSESGAIERPACSALYSNTICR